jgi:CMP-N-acetylneuraminic acid synthetase
MICIIPARGGSKRLPGKNIKELDGIPIINRVIKTVWDSHIFEHIIVTTDSQEILDAIKYTVAEGELRPPELSGDIAEDKVTRQLAESLNQDTFCRVYPFAALLTPERLCAGYKQFLTGKYENVHECQEYTHSIWRAIYEKGGYYSPHDVSDPTELLVKMYHEAGTYMFTTLDALSKPLAERVMKWMPISEMEAQDIDDINDWHMLEAKYNWGNR